MNYEEPNYGGIRYIMLDQPDPDNILYIMKSRPTPGDILDVIHTVVQMQPNGLQQLMMAAAYTAERTPDEYTFEQWWTENQEKIWMMLGEYHGPEGFDYPKQCWDEARHVRRGYENGKEEF